MCGRTLHKLIFDELAFDLRAGQPPVEIGADAVCITLRWRPASSRLNLEVVSGTTVLDGLDEPRSEIAKTGTRRAA